MTSQAMWMVRAGEGGLAIEAFRAESVVAIGWVDLGDLSALNTRADFEFKFSIAVNIMISFSFFPTRSELHHFFNCFKNMFKFFNNISC